MTKFDEINGNITHSSGDTLELLFTDVKEDGVLIDWTNWSAVLQVKENPTDENPLIELSTAGGGINLNVNGELKIEADAETMTLPPKTYFYSLQMTRPNGKVETWLRTKKFIVEEDLIK